MSDAWNEKEVFLAALALPAPDREAFLEGACPDEHARARIRSLLEHHAGSTASLGGSPAPPAPEGETPTQIDEFRVLARIGEGGMGIVYLAEDTILGRKVALKVLASHLTGSEQALARFRAEAKSAAGLRHPAIVPVFKFGFDGGRHYLASEYVDGPTLGEVISAERNHRQETGAGADDKAWHRRAAQIVAVIADALDASHRAGIVHRDVKPSNILIDNERGPRLTDFGIAKHLTEEPRTRFTGVIGSCHYMSPEQAAIAGARVDQRSDIFSLGVVLYETLSLHKPFDGSDVAQVLRAVTAASPQRLRSHHRAIAKDLETICHTALQKDPARRYQTAAHMAADLRCFLEGRPILARPPSVPRRVGAWIRRRQRAAVAIALVALTAALIAAAFAVRNQRLESLTWLEVDSGSARCDVFLQRYDAGAGRLRAIASRLGQSPRLVRGLSPGQYRLTVVNVGSGAFAEFNLLMSEPGKDKITKVTVHSDNAAGLSAARPAGSAAPAPRRLSGRLVRSDDPVLNGMMPIEGGECTLARSAASHPLLKGPAHLDPFLIDARKVSNREYKEFTDSTGEKLPNFWRAFGYPAAQPDLPVTGVTLEEAEAYARWRGKRLPTLIEWQAAARGPGGDLYPWGDEPPSQDHEPNAAVIGSAQSSDATAHLRNYLAFCQPVSVNGGNQKAGRPWQMFSSVRELCADADLAGRGSVIVGRCWRDIAPNLTLETIRSGPLSTPSIEHGFRCAKSMSPPSTSSSSRKTKGGRNV